MPRHYHYPLDPDCEEVQAHTTYVSRMSAVDMLDDFHDADLTSEWAGYHLQVCSDCQSYAMVNAEVTQ